MTGNWDQGHSSGLHPADAAGLELFARGEISSREFVRRVLARMGAEIPETLQGERRAITAKPVTLKSFATPRRELPTVEPVEPLLPPTPNQVGSAPAWFNPAPVEKISQSESPTQADSEQDAHSEEQFETTPAQPGSSSMSEDTAAILRGELDIDGWLKRAEEKYRTL